MKKLVALTLCLLFSSNTVSMIMGPCNTEECKEYFEQYKRFAKKGYKVGMDGVGNMYFHGYGTEKNITKAIKQFKNGAKWGSSISAYRLGYIYLTEKDHYNLKLATKYLKQSARNRHSGAALLLSAIYSDPAMDMIDYQASDKYLRIAYKYKNPSAIEMINKLVQSKNFTEENYPQITELINEIGFVETSELADKETSDVSTPAEKTQALSSKLIAWPTDDDTEVITVNPPTLVQIMDYEIKHLKVNYNPDRFRVMTGSMIIGNGCDHNVACGEADLSEFNRLIDTSK